MELKPDQLLKNRYKIVGALGKGGMGTVYRAMDTAVNRDVAVKSNINTFDYAMEQFEREAKMLAGLRHKNLPLVTDHFTIDDIQYLVMDYAPGDDLSTLLKKEGARSVEDILDWGKQLGSALTYLHNQNPPIIHRDVKPANIKIAPDGRLVLVDFGIAKTADQAMTSTGARGYTPGYAPPEQYGSASTGPYSDQYALAATLYAMLCGRAPVESIERMLERETLVPPMDINSTVTQHINDTLVRALALQPEDRFVSIDEFVESLLVPTFAPTLPRAPLTQTRPGSGAKPPREKIKINPLFLWGSLLTFMVIAIVAVVFIFSASLSGSGEGGNENGSSADDLTAPVVAVIATETPTPSLPTETPTPRPTLAPPSVTPTPTQVGKDGLIAFVSNRAAGKIFQIYTIRPDGSDLKQLTFDQVDKSQPAWSPDGTEILYVADGGESFGTSLGLDVWIINADGSIPTNLTKSAGDDTDPHWMSDGSKIAFTSERNTGLRQIYYMNPDGAALEFISKGFGVEFDPAWSPDGVWLAFSLSINDAPERLGLRIGIGRDPRYLNSKEQIGQARQPAWSPDGKNLAYTGVKDGNENIFYLVFDSLGDQIFQVTKGLANRNPDWASDGQWLVFTSNRDGNQEIYISNLRGQQQFNITLNTSIDREPSWQPVK